MNRFLSDGRRSLDSWWIKNHRTLPAVAFVVACGTLSATGSSVHAAATMFIANYGSATNSPLAYDTRTHVVTVVDNKNHIAGTFVAPDPSNPAALNLFASQDNGATSTILKYPFNPGTVTPFGSASTFAGSITDAARGMAYSPLNNTIYLTTINTNDGAVRPFTASGGGAGTPGTPIVLAVNARPFGVSVDSAGMLWVVALQNNAVAQLYKYDPGTNTVTLKDSLAGGLWARDAIAPANFAGGTFTGDIFFTDLLHNSVQFFNPTTNTHGTLTNIGANLLNGPAGIGFDPSDGTLYVTNSNNGTVVKYNSATTTFQYPANLGPGNGILNGNNDLSFFVIPEPASLGLVVVGGAMLLRRRG